MEPKHRYWRVSEQLTIHGLEWVGEGPLAVLLHANGLCAETWSAVVSQLASEYHVFALDARGHGASSSPQPPDAYQWQHFVDDTVAVCGQILAETGQPRFELAAGSSLGGIIVAAVAAAQKKLFRRIVMLDPPIRPGEELFREMEADMDGEAMGRKNIADQARKRRSIWPSREAAAASYQQKPMFKEWHPDAFEAYLRAGFKDREDGQVELACDPAVEASIFESTGSLDIFERARSVEIPVQLIRASKGYFPEQLFEHLAACFPQCELSTINGGHLLPLEQPQETACLLLNGD